ncbi:Kif1b, partial [Symbiodinium sp. KB8]
MNLVDLAGSESAKDFMASKAGDWQRTRLRETSHINRSLFMLGHCMALLASGKDKHRQDPLRGGGLMASGSGRRRQRDAEAYESDDSSVGTAAYSEASSVASAKALGSGHVPYRGSILTMLLKENLGGNARTTLLATLSPSEVDLRTTLSTLRYADRARYIKTKAVVNSEAPKQLVEELK